MDCTGVNVEYFDWEVMEVLVDAEGVDEGRDWNRIGERAGLVLYEDIDRD
jgi:hypothetical protein